MPHSNCCELLPSLRWPLGAWKLVAEKMARGLCSADPRGRCTDLGAEVLDSLVFSRVHRVQ